MKDNKKAVFSAETFDYDKIKIGDFVDAEVVMNAMNLLPPACMRLSCAQVGEPYSHREDPDTGRLRATFSTFKCVKGGFNYGVWEYCGNCFRGETIERGADPVYC